MNVAAKVRAEKENHPERFCSEKNCLWRVVSRDGLNPCQKHPRTLAGQMISLRSSESRDDELMPVQCDGCDILTFEPQYCEECAEEGRTARFCSSSACRDHANEHEPA